MYCYCWKRWILNLIFSGASRLFFHFFPSSSALSGAVDNFMHPGAYIPGGILKFAWNRVFQGFNFREMFYHAFFFYTVNIAVENSLFMIIKFIIQFVT